METALELMIGAPKPVLASTAVTFTALNDSG